MAAQGEWISRGAARRMCDRAVWLLAVACLVGALLAPASAGARTLHHAGVVVRFGDGHLTYAYVAFPEQTITGLELLQRTRLPLVTVGFGGLGEAVCEIADEGCPASTCAKRLCQTAAADSPFWQYFRQTSPGNWQSLSLGASESEVRDGDVDGWSWTGTTAGLPALTLADVARLAGATDAAAASVGNAVPPPVVHTIYPAGVKPKADRARQGWATYAIAAAIVAVIAGAALYLGRWRRGGSP